MNIRCIFLTKDNQGWSLNLSKATNSGRLQFVPFESLNPLRDNLCCHFAIALSDAGIYLFRRTIGTIRPHEEKVFDSTRHISLSKSLLNGFPSVMGLRVHKLTAAQP